MAETTDNDSPELGLNPAAKEPVVVVDNLHVKYKVFSSGRAAGGAASKGLFTRASKGLKEVHALKGISFTAYKNESIGVIGSNGSGKSTLLRTITGLTPASEGAVWASSRPNLLGVGAALIPALSGNDNITLGCLALGFNRAEIEELRPQIIEFAELQDFIDFPMKTYSSGMSARLKFAIAASKQHDILIVDEALAVGDARFRKRSEAKIREIRENAGTVFLVSHSMRSIRSTCTRAIWIEKGVQKMDGTPDEVIKAYEASRSASNLTAEQKAAAAKKRKLAAARKRKAEAAKKAAAEKRAADPTTD
ncbi:ABC transporter ATP-binding protein [Galactobacter sp.]|uniref:ABC transporter ATP-binding protein n=1 Tax=Galactobacter sp. TaxID=2676125 RepID=UPI00345D6203